MTPPPTKNDSSPADPGGVLDQVFKSQIGKLVAFGLAPLLALAIPPVVDALNTALGTDFSNQEISNIAIATVVGIAIVIWQWLRNRGNWERTIAEIYALYERGQGAVPAIPPPPYDADVDDPPASSALGMNRPTP